VENQQWYPHLRKRKNDMEHLNEACWDGYKQVGMKKVQGRMVPNCIPIDEAFKDDLTKLIARGVLKKQEPKPDFKSMSPEERREYMADKAERSHPAIPLDMLAQHGKGATKQQAQFALSTPMAEDELDEGKLSKLAGAAALALAAGKAGAQGHPTLGPVDAQRADSAAMMTHAKDYMNAPASSDAEITALNRFGTSAKSRAGRVFTTQARNIPDYQGPENVRRRASDSTAFVDASMLNRMADLQKQKQAAIDAGSAELGREKISRDADANKVYTGATQRALDTLAGQLKPKVQENEVNEYCPRCLIEVLSGQHPEQLGEAQYQGRTVSLGKPMRGDVKKFKVFVKDPKTGNVKKVNFGDKTMKIKKSNPARRRSFRARHHCDTNPGPRTKARYWSCRKW
jgi:hypothetical protein